MSRESREILQELYKLKDRLTAMKMEDRRIEEGKEDLDDDLADFIGDYERWLIDADIPSII